MHGAHHRLGPGPRRRQGIQRGNDVSQAYITPYIFVGDLRTGPIANFDVRRTGRALAFQPPASRRTDFVAAAHSCDYIINQDPVPGGWPADSHEWAPDKVYVRIAGYPKCEPGYEPSPPLAAPMRGFWHRSR